MKKDGSQVFIFYSVLYFFILLLLYLDHQIIQITGKRTVKGVIDLGGTPWRGKQRLGDSPDPEGRYTL